MAMHEQPTTRFAPVAPVHILQELCNSGALGEYHLFLAHHTVEKPKEFTDLFDSYFRAQDRRPSRLDQHARAGCAGVPSLNRDRTEFIGSSILTHRVLPLVT